MNEIDELAVYIMKSIPGEPSRSEGAGIAAIRLLRKYRAALLAIRRELRREVREGWRLSPSVEGALDMVERALFHPNKLKKVAWCTRPHGNTCAAEASPEL